MMTNETILALFERICKPFKDKKGGPKVDEVQSFFKEHGIESVYVPNQGLFVNKQPSPRLMIMAHMDLIPLFNKRFKGYITDNTVSNEKVSKDAVLKDETDETVTDKVKQPEPPFLLYDGKKGETFVRGCLDNTICNAVAMLVFLELYKDGMQDLQLFLSEGEEVGSVGADNYFKEASKDGLLDNTFIINMDVTNEFWGSDVSLEYDRPNFQMIKQIQKILTDNGIKVGVTGDRVCDDCDSINDFDLSGSSLCIPTKGTIHSYKNKLKLDTLLPFYNALKLILTKVDYSIDFKANISKWSVDEIDKYETFEEMKKDEEKMNKKRYYQSSFYFYEDDDDEFDFFEQKRKTGNDLSAITETGVYLTNGSFKAFSDMSDDELEKYAGTRDVKEAEDLGNRFYQERAMELDESLFTDIDYSFLMSNYLKYYNKFEDFCEVGNFIMKAIMEGDPVKVSAFHQFLSQFKIKGKQIDGLSFVKNLKKELPLLVKKIKPVYLKKSGDGKPEIVDYKVYFHTYEELIVSYVRDVF